MAATDIYGPSVALPTIERAVLAHIQLWLPAYLRDQERTLEIDADGNPLATGSLPMPRGWEVTSEPNVSKWPETQLPAVVFGSNGLLDEPRRAGDGAIEADWGIGLTVIASGNTERHARWNASVYTAALRNLLVQQKLIDGLDVLSVHWLDEDYNLIARAQNRSLMAGAVTVNLTLADVANAFFGPAEPPPDPIPDPGPLTEVTSTELDLERSPIA